MSTTLYGYEPLRDIAGRAIYDVEEEANNPNRPDWYSLSEERREPWRKDADRVLRAIFHTHPGHPELAALGISFSCDANER